MQVTLEQLRIWRGTGCLGRCQHWRESLGDLTQGNPSRDPRWLAVLARSLGHEPYCVELSSSEELLGILPLALVKSLLFGRHLVSLPYVSTSGVIARNLEASKRLITAAVELSRHLGARQLQLRQETHVVHTSLTSEVTGKVHMRLSLPTTTEQLWPALSPKVRNQIRKAEKQSLAVVWGRDSEHVAAFYDVFAANMRDLGTPVYSRSLFDATLRVFGDDAEICLVSAGDTCIAAGIIVHGDGMTLVPSASSLRAYNPTCANMLLYWRLLARAIERGQTAFDFGRCTPGSGPHRFKSQWNAVSTPAIWQCHIRQGSPAELRPDRGKFAVASRIWKYLPVRLTRWLGPPIVRGIP